MMKRIADFIAVFVLLFNTVVYADYSVSTVKDSIFVSGTAEPYSIVSFMLIDSAAFDTSDAQSTIDVYNAKVDSGAQLSTNDIFYFKALSADSAGEWSFEVPMPSGEYEKKLTLVSSFGSTEYIEYASIAFKNNMLPVLISAAQTNDDGTALKDKISLYIAYIYDQKDEYFTVNNKLKIAKINKEMVASLSSDDETALSKLEAGIKEAIFILDIEEGRETDYSVMMSETEYEIAKESQLTDEGKSKIVSNLGSLKYSSMDDYKTNAKLQFYINLVNYNKNSSADSLLTVLKDSNSVLKLDFTKFNRLSDAGKGKAAKQLAEKKSNNIAEMQTNLDAIADKVYKEEHSNSGGSSRGGNFGGGTSSSKENAITYVPVVDNTPSNKNTYSDINKAEWASEAITNLSEKGIIAGYEDGTFRPLDSITRAEFVKLIIKAFYTEIKPASSSVFADVTSDKWYSDYVNSAFEKGIVSGDNYGNFNPDSTISRQDMAVIIYNAGSKFGLFNNVSTDAEFSDEASISDYAKKAVYALKNAGVINGVGNNLFAPNDNSNRASAAKIVHSLMQTMSK